MANEYTISHSEVELEDGTTVREITQIGQQGYISLDANGEVSASLLAGDRVHVELLIDELRKVRRNM